MDQLILILLPISAIGVLIVMMLALIRAIHVHLALRDRDGGELSEIIVVVMAGLLASQLLLTVSAIGIGTSAVEQTHRWAMFLASQLIIIVIAAWAFRRLATLE